MKDDRIKTQNASSIHRWHSSEYVKEWSHKAQQDLVARQGHKFLLSLLPFPSESEIRLLELMAGYGRLSQYILSAFPRSQMTLVDFSRLMQRRAKEHLSQFLERLQFILADIDDSSWKNKVEGDYDVVVSSKAIHDLQLSSQRRLYRQVFALLKSGGCFFDYDFAWEDDPLANRFIRSALGREWKEKPFDPSPERNPERHLAPTRRGDSPRMRTLTLSQRLTAMRRAGFVGVGCYWRHLNHAVYGGFKP